MNLTEQVKGYISFHPFVKQTLALNIANHSALARKIISDLGLKKSAFDGVLAACRRFESSEAPGTLVRALKTADFQLRSDITVAYPEALPGKRRVEFSLSSANGNLVVEKGDSDFAMITITPKESTDELFPFAMSLLYENGLQVHAAAYNGKTIKLIIKQNDMAKAMMAFDL